jgi:hypothetical protein
VSSAASVSERLIRAVLPKGGYVAGFYEMYVDESGTHDGSPVMCVGGYIFSSERAIRLSKAWQRILDKYQLPYFRMSLCAPGKAPPFDKLNDNERIALVKELINVITNNMALGFAVSVSEEEFNRLVPEDRRIPGPYAFCLRQCLVFAYSWIEQNNLADKMAFFFEAGHRDQSRANEMMNRMASSPVIKDRYRYVGHAFADKKEMLPLQAADLLAWQWFTDRKRKLSGKHASRADLLAMVGRKRHAYECMDWSAVDLMGIEPIVMRDRQSDDVL